MGDLRVLLVDDEPPILHGLRHHVPWRELGFEVVATCTDGNAALSILRDRPVDVVLSDIRMPNLDGLELCRIARGEFPDLVVILLTAFKDFEYARRAVEIGAWRYLLKPTNFPALYAALEELHCASRENASSDRFAGGLAERVTAWVESHFQEATLERAAAAVGLNPQYVSRRFSELTGDHFSELVQRTRMKHAARLLRGSRYRTYEISRIVGYSSPKNFTRRFREFYGTSPSAFRRSEASDE